MTLTWDGSRLKLYMLSDGRSALSGCIKANMEDRSERCWMCWSQTSLHLYSTRPYFPDTTASTANRYPPLLYWAKTKKYFFQMDFAD